MNKRGKAKESNSEQSCPVITCIEGANPLFSAYNNSWPGVQFALRMTKRDRIRFQHSQLYITYNLRYIILLLQRTLFHQLIMFLFNWDFDVFI